MKSRELMIGDWVAAPYNNVYYPCKVTAVFPTEVHVKEETMAIKTICDEWDEVKPIPLTVEIMKANGYDFIEDYINYIYDNSEGSYLEMTLNDDDEFVWSINTNEYDITQIKYVHELQHALRLLGIEKEIVVEFDHLKKPDC